jgi:hypothetical protein
MSQHYFLIKYRFNDGEEGEWRDQIARFIAAIDAAPELKGKLSYLCLKNRGGNDYYHLASAADEGTIETLEKSAWFSSYTEKIKKASAGTVEVLPLELIGRTP